MNFLVILTLTLLTSLGGVKGTAKTYDGVLKSLKYNDKLIFDVTTPINTNLSEGSSFDVLNMSTILDEVEVYQSPILYYRPRMNKQNGSTPVQKFFLFQRHSKLTRTSNPTNPSASDKTGDFRENNLTSIFPVPHFSRRFALQSEEVDKLKRIITAFQTDWKNQNVSVGLEYKWKLDGSEINLNSLKPVINLVDVLIADIDIPSKEFVLSYSKFKTKLRRSLDRNGVFLRKMNSTCKIFAKLNFPVDRPLVSQKSNFNMTEELYRKYYYYLLQFSVYWVNDGEREALILETFNNDLSTEEGFDGRELRELVTTYLNPRLGILESGQCREIKSMLNQVSSHLKAISLDTEELKRFPKLDENCPEPSTSWENTENNTKGCNQSMSDLKYPELNIRYKIKSTRNFAFDDLSTILTIFSNISWNLFEINALNPALFEDRNNLDIFERGLRELPPSVTVACSAHGFGLDMTTNFFKEIQDQCGFMWNHVKVIVWNFSFLDAKYMHLVVEKLFSIESKRQQFLERYPDKSVTLRVHLQAITNFSNEGGVGLYCRPNILEINAKSEVILNFARVHSFPLEIKDVLDWRDQVGWWKEVKVLDGLNTSKVGFSVFVARNYPEKFLDGDFQKDPCIMWTEEVPDGGLLLNDYYTGTTFNMNGLKGDDKSPNIKELQNLFLFTLHKFSLLELIPASILDLKTVIQLLSRKEFTKELAQQKSKEPKLYIAVDCQFFNGSTKNFKNVLTDLQNRMINPKGIHLVNWENSLEVDDADLDNTFGSFKSNKVMLGLSLEDCLNEVNLGFENVEGFSKFQYVDYILCNIKYPMKSTNADKPIVEKYLDTTLFIRKYFERVFPDQHNIEILFRFNSVPVERNTFDNFIKFFSDVGQYATLYKMKFFMFPTFDDVSKERFGWWEISNFDDLASTTAFRERESIFLNQSTWKPTPSRPEEPPMLTTTQLILLVLGVSMSVLFVIFGSALAYVRFWYKRRLDMLSQKEVEVFRNGIYEEGKGTAVGEELYDNLKFPKEYEIPKREYFKLSNVLGKGNFGEVYNAMLLSDDGNENDETQVAIKVPNSDCSKVSFKSMLSELKILCYIGNHPNVMGFRGAYIKEIAKGVVYIATEFCGNGSLIEYLREFQSESQTQSGSSHEEDMQSSVNEEGNHYTIPRHVMKNKIQEARKQPNMEELSRLAHEIAMGMEYIGMKKIVHGDLSARNVLLDGNFHCKIGDFGLSRKLYEYAEYVKQSAEPLPWRWMAVESLKRMEFTTKSDVWSYGVTLWEIFSLGNIPYPGLSWTVGFMDELENGLRMASPKYSTKEINELMIDCWNISSERRPTFTQISQFFAISRNVVNRSEASSDYTNAMEFQLTAANYENLM